jgi:hypothetical protein
VQPTYSKISLAHLGKLAAIVTATAWLTMIPALAQVSTFRANIPFPFVVGNQTLPPALYVVQRFLGKPKAAKLKPGTPEASNDMGVIVMKANDRHVYKVIVTEPGEDRQAVRSEGSRLVFTSFKGKQYLNRIWVAGDAVAHQLPSIANDISISNATGEVIVTALNYSRNKRTTNNDQ